MQGTGFVAALLAALVAASHGASVQLIMSGGECSLTGDTEKFSANGVSYSVDGQRLFAVEFNGKDVKCCHVEVVAPTTTTTPAPEVIRWRSDYRCGPGFKDPQGNEAICNPNSGHKCCSNWGWCDGTAAHCECSGCTDWSKKLGTTTTSTTTTTTPAPLIRWRSDYRCGPGFKDPQGNEAICNPNSGHKCCSNYGWCDGTAAHCNCSGCTDWSKKLGTTTTSTTTTTTPAPLVLANLGQFTSNRHPCTGANSAVMG